MGRLGGQRGQGRRSSCKQCSEPLRPNECMASPTFGLPVNGTPRPRAIDTRRRRYPGRHTRLTAESHAAIVERLRHGASFNAACRQTGIPVGTGRDWLARGRGTHAAGRSAAPIYAAFATAIERAECQNAGKAVDPVQEAWKELIGTILQTAPGKDYPPGVISTMVAERYVYPAGEAPIWNTGCKHIKAIVKTKRRKDGTLEVVGSKLIEQDVPPDWRAAVRFLERMFPENWSLAYQLRHSLKTKIEVIFDGYEAGPRNAIVRTIE